MTSYVHFKILEDVELPFEYSLYKEGIYKADSSQPGIDTADQNELIEVISWNASDNNQKQFKGEAEPIYDNGLKFVIPSEDGRTLDIKRFGEWGCLRCGYINYVEINGTLKEPFECQNDTCGRKGPFKPTFPKDLIKPIWKIPNKPIEASAQEIYLDILCYLKSHLILKDEEYHIIALWIMASWLVDDFDTAPYLLFIAPKSSGKTQALSIIHELGYRSYLTVSITASAIFRASDLWHITPLIDESEFQLNTEKPSESSQALYGLLNGGYKRGNSALRIEGEARIPTSFNIFGFKAIASTKIFLPTLESRSIIINMAQGMPENILIDTERSKIIRSKLLHFRFSTLGKLKTVIPKSNSGRLTELFIPLYTTAQILKDIPGRQQAIKYDALQDILKLKLESMESDRKNEEKSSPEASVVRAIDELKKLNVDAISSKTIALQVNWVDKDDSKAFRAVQQKIGYLLKSLGIKTKRTDEANIINLTDEKTLIKIDELKRRYIDG